jgi:MFS family permease
VLNAYALFFGALLIPAGRFADKYGRKATFILGQPFSPWRAWPVR